MNSNIERPVVNINEESTWSANYRRNGRIVDFRTCSILNGLVINEVESVERMLRLLVCASGSPGIYISSPEGGKRAHKIIHAVENGLKLTQESFGRGIGRHVIVKRQIHWPLFSDRYIRIANIYIDTIAKYLHYFLPDLCVQRKIFLRGNSSYKNYFSEGSSCYITGIW